MNTPGLSTAVVCWDERLGGFVVSGHDQVAAVLRGEGWSSDPRHSPVAPDALREMSGGSLLFSDPPEHTRLRRVLGPAFTPRAVERLRPRVAAIVDAALDDLPERFDVLADVGYPVPLAVIAELFDVGVAGAELFAEVTPDLVRLLELDAGPDDVLASGTAAAELTLFLTPILARRRAEPGSDFISALLAGSELSLDEVLATCILLLTAGHETTANLITTSTLALLHAPDQVPYLLADPERAVAELLRTCGAVKLAVRTSLVGHEIGGQHIAAGQAVFLRLDAANRDAGWRPDPEVLDLRGDPTGHLAFGAGVHFCLGAALARLETVETLTRLFTRYPDLALDAEPRWRDSTTFHGLLTLPVQHGGRQ